MNELIQLADSKLVYCYVYSFHTWNDVARVELYDRSSTTPYLWKVRVIE